MVTNNNLVIFERADLVAGDFFDICPDFYASKAAF